MTSPRVMQAVDHALAAWGIDHAETELVAQRENIVFSVRTNTARYALRLHRPGYQTPDMIRSELDWMRHLGSSGIRVPRPLPAQSGALLMDVGGFQADLLSWMDGAPMGATGHPLDLPERTETFQRLGQTMAQIHTSSDSWNLPDGFIRQAWDLEGLLGETPLWGRFWDNPGLSGRQRDKVLHARAMLQATLERDAGDFGLIHADLLRENVMIDEDRIGVIDFDDSGFGYRLFDVATTLLKNRAEPDYPDLERAFLAGYRSMRALETNLLEHFVLIRALSYLGWIIPRLNEPMAALRQSRFLATALPMVDAFLESGH